ncbi:MAG: carboxypeptidase regulatory-like domain-containing protein [Pyrinomonadaceae bacterium]
MCALPLLVMALVTGALAAPKDKSSGNVVIDRQNAFGTIRGVVRDDGGSPIADATVAIFKAGTQTLLKQVSSAADGSFIAKILPGTYTVLAVAEGFNPVTLFGVEVGRSADLTYGFKLEHAGNGNTLPEKRADKNSSKWRIRAAQMSRSIYQHQSGDTSIGDAALAQKEEPKAGRKTESVVETYFAGGGDGNFQGLNFATLMPLGGDSEVVFAAQTGLGRGAPQRVAGGFNFKPVSGHNIRLTASAGKLGAIKTTGVTLAQFTTGGTDEWHLSNGAILVLGFDYAKFAGAGSDASLSPRIGFQYDLNAKTRVRAAFTTQTTEHKSWSQLAELEGDSSFSFAEPVAVPDLVIVGGKPQMNKSRRFEFGIERVLDSASTIEANAFVDTTYSQGVSLSFDGLNDSIGEMVADQHGASQGLRLVYQRRLAGPFTAAAGYALGNGQRLSPSAVSEPSHLFETGFFQTFFAQLAADMKSGTSVRAVFRLSPDATVFAIDPFKGRLAIYDPGLSVYVTQTLPTFGMPFRAEAVVDGRNLFDTAPTVTTEAGSLTFAGQRRLIRGGIQLRF